MIAAGALFGAGVSTVALASTGNLNFSKAEPSAAVGMEDPAQGSPRVAEHEAPAVPEDPEQSGLEPWEMFTPEHHEQGAPVISAVGEPFGTSITTRAQIPLGDRPDGATHVRVTLTCVTDGSFKWGTHPRKNPRFTCSSGESSWGDYPLDGKTNFGYVTGRSGEQASVTIQFLQYVPTEWGVNANGETFGTDNLEGEQPDLLAVWLTDATNEYQTGYVRTEELDNFSADHTGLPSSPEQAIEWQTEREAKYLDGWDIPAYKSDGVTQIGTFHVG